MPTYEYQCDQCRRTSEVRQRITEDPLTVCEACGGSLRRLISAATLAELARVMRPGAELRLATDIPAYARVMLLALEAQPAFIWTAQSAADWRVRGPDWPATRYEQKALAQGRRCSYLRFRRL